MKMKKVWSAPVALIVVLTMALFFGGITVSADTTGSCGDNVTWTIEDGTLTISGSGAMYDYHWYDELPWKDDSVTKIVIDEGVTRIGDNAFTDMRSVTSLTFPSTLKSVGEYSFSNIGITELTVPANLESLGEYAFNACHELLTLTIPSNTQLTSIAKGAFSYCENLSAVNLPDKITGIDSEAFRNDGSLVLTSLPANVKTLGDYAFANCTSLTTIELDNKLESVGASAFSGCTNIASVTFPDSLKTIGNWAFSQTAITSLALPAGVTTIENAAFNQCNSLTAINLSFTGNISIGESAFSNCANLQSVTITGNLTSISGYIFSGDPLLSSVSVPDSVTSIGNWAFSGCGSLNSFTWPSSLTTVGDYVFSSSGLESVTIPANVTFGTGIYFNCRQLSQVTVEDGVTAISREMFSSCDNLKTVNLPDSLTTISEGAFKFSGLTAIDIPASVKVVSESAFSDCRDLESITLHEGLEQLDDNAFECCEKVESIEVPDSCKLIGNRVFACWSNLKSITLTINDDELHVPKELFSGDNNIESITIKGNLSKIPYKMFASCYKLKNLTLPDTVTEIDYGAFEYCRSLSDFTIPANVTTIGSNAFCSCKALTSLTIPSKVESIGDGAFYASGLTSIVIPNNVTTFGSGMFYECRDLVSITLPTNITSIPSNFFSGCRGLNTYSIPSYITRIDSYAFSDCGLTEIRIPGTVKTIDEQAFANCGSLIYVEIQEGVETVGDEAFCLCGALETVVIGSTVTDLAPHAFIYCDTIKTIFCTAAQKKVLEDHHQGVEFIIIGSISELDTPHLVGHSITLSADIGMNFFIRLPQDYSTSNVTVEFTWGEGTDSTTNNSYVHNVNGTLVPVSEHGANYMVTCGVAARAMTDTITMVVKNGNTEILRDEYTIVEYMKTLMDSTNDYYLPYLLLAMAHYGSCSQEYFNYRTYSKPYDLLDYSGWDSVEEYKENFIDSDDFTVDEANMTIKGIGNDGMGLKYYGASILCASQMKMRFYFEVTDANAFKAVNGTASFKGQSLKFIKTKVNGKSLVYIETQGLGPGALENIFEISIGGNVYKYDFKDFILRVGSVEPRFVDTAKYIYAFSHFANMYKIGEYYDA